MKWGALYGAEYVNVLYQACQAHISGDFRFVCLTDDATGIMSGVEVFAIPDIGLEHSHYYHGAWPKISVFQKELYGLKGRCLFIDLDTIIWGNLDPLFESKGDFIAINNVSWGKRNKLATRTMSSVFAFDFGALPDLVDHLRLHRDEIIKKHVIEQEYLHHALPSITYWPQEWLASFKHHLRQPLILDRFLPPIAPSNEVRLVIFHGQPRPIDLIRPPKGNWDRFPHYGSGQVKWMCDYWKKYGGTF